MRRLPNPKRHFDQRVRAAAIKQVRKDLILHGKSEHHLSQDDLEYLVANAEAAKMPSLNDPRKANGLHPSTTRPRAVPPLMVVR